jgi:hypothetical protein
VGVRGAEKRREPGRGANPKLGLLQQVGGREGVARRDTVPVHARDTGSHRHAPGRRTWVPGAYGRYPRFIAADRAVFYTNSLPDCISFRFDELTDPARAAAQGSCR